MQNYGNYITQYVNNNDKFKLIIKFEIKKNPLFEIKDIKSVYGNIIDYEDTNDKLRGKCESVDNEHDELKVRKHLSVGSSIQVIFTFTASGGASQFFLTMTDYGSSTPYLGIVKQS